MSYCKFVLEARAHPLHRSYHDTEYGRHSDDERVLFERLVLEINQAGLSWETILKKRSGFGNAYDNFVVDRVAEYGEEARARLMNDAGIIRNRLKIEAAIHNARVIQGFRDSHGGFHDWIKHHHPLDREQWTKLFRKTFRFTGGEIVNEFLMSLGFLPGAHDAECLVFQELQRQNPAWLRLGP